MPNRIKIAWCFYLLVVSIFAVFAYGLTVPNLVLHSSALFWQFQTFMWRTFFNQRVVLTQTYVVLVTCLFAVYGYLIWQTLRQPQILTWKIWRSYLPWLVVLLIPLWFGYNALSADIFNYIFNARMIVLYHANPYVQVALDFPSDPWTRFMHNVHTTSPYGYGWTAFSTILYVLGLGKFLWTWLLFKASAMFSLLALSIAYGFDFKDEYYGQISLTSFLVVLLNPLFLLEYGLRGHNDIWMMVLALISFRLLVKKGKLPDVVSLIVSLGLLALSVTLKFATELLVPIWILVALVKFWPNLPLRSFILKWWPVLASVVMFLPLATARSQYFNPWYLSWSFVWIPLFPWRETGKWLKEVPLLLTTILISFSVTSLVRYIPWLLTNGYGNVVLREEYVITWSAIPLALIVFVVWHELSARLQPKTAIKFNPA